MRYLLFILLLQVTNALIADPSLSYKLSMPEPWTHYIEVEMTIDENRDRRLELKMATWTPGSYLIREYARHLEGLTAEDADGNQLGITKLNKNTWEVETGDAKELTVRYRIYAFEHSVRTPYVDDEHAAIIPAGVFLYMADHDVPSTITFEPYRDWDDIATALPKVDGNPWVRAAPGIDILFDTPIEIGDLEVVEFEAAGIPHTLAIQGQGNYDAEELAEPISNIVEACTDIFGSNPNEEYLFILNTTESGGGGLEHLNSTSLISSRWGFQSESSRRGFLSLVSHEYFHLWNAKRIRPEALGPFNYDEENYTRALWVVEGFTSYYDDLLLRRADIISEQAYLDIASKNITNTQNRAGDRVQPVADASFDAWIKYYRPHENSSNTTVSYYSKGAVVAMMLDLLILSETKGNRSLDDVMKALWRDFQRRPEEGYTDAEFQNTVEKVAGMELDEFWADYVDGTERIDFASFFESLGLEVVNELEGRKVLRFGAAIDGSNRISRVVRGEPAYEAGISAKDELISIDGWRVRNGDVSSVLHRIEEGSTVDVVIARKGRIMTMQVQMVGQERSRFALRTMEDPSEIQQKLYDQWLRVVVD